MLKFENYWASSLASIPLISICSSAHFQSFFLNRANLCSRRDFCVSVKYVILARKREVEKEIVVFFAVQHTVENL